MSLIDKLTSLFASGFAIIEAVGDATCEELKNAHIPPHLANQLVAARRMLFGATTHSRYQKRVRKVAVDKQLDVLLIIAQTTARVKHETTRWRLREELLASTLAAEPLRKYANKRIKDLQPPAPPEPGITYTRHRGDAASVKITTDSATIADLKANLKDLNDLTALFDGTLAKQPIATTVTITLDELTDVIRGDDSVEIIATNGARYTGEEFVNRMVADYGYAVLFHPLIGPIDAFRTARTANYKQALMARAETNTCVWPDCRRPADETQIHHLKAWKNGGNTNQENLCCLCAFHNAVNDDERLHGKFGYMTRIDGKLQWVPPTTGHVDANAEARLAQDRLTEVSAK